MTSIAASIPTACPCCFSEGLEAFHSVEGIPVQSNLLAATRADAIELPRGALALAFCPACGFITNTAFDPATQELTAKYEATQGCSGTFNAFARRLAERWARDYLGPDKLALEIGCGRGEFIQLLHEVSGCRAVGLDPVLDQAAIAGASGAVRLISDAYSEEYADVLADLVVCRHTLEHIPNAGEFVRIIRRAIGQ